MAQLFGLARLGRDAEIKYTPAGDAVASLALAFDYGKKVDGKKPTQWVNGSLWGKRAEALAPYLTKGQQVAITLDDVHIRTWPKDDGTQGFALEGRVNDLSLAGGQQAPQRSEPQQAAARQQPAHTQGKQQSGNFDDFDDELPPF